MTKEMTFAEKAMALMTEAQALGVPFKMKDAATVVFYYDGDSETFSATADTWRIIDNWEPWLFAARRYELAAAAALESARTKMRNAAVTLLDEQEQAAFVNWLQTPNNGLVL